MNLLLKVSYQPDFRSKVSEACRDFRNSSRGLIVIDGDAYELRSGIGECRYLSGGTSGISCVGVRHRLDDDRVR